MRATGTVLAALGLCLGCGLAPQQLLGTPVHQRVSIMMTVSQEVADADQAGGVATLAETVSDRLKEQGIASQIYASKYDQADPKAPLIQLDVQFWSEPSSASKKFAAAGFVVPGLGLVALATGGNHIIVDCSVFFPGTKQRAFFRRYRSSGLASDLTGTDDTSSAENAGNAIARDIFDVKQRGHLYALSSAP